MLSNQKKQEHLILAVIIIIGAILRLWNFNSIPFMQDELSALSRLQFDDLHEVIKHGVMLGDTHPAGVQVFLYFWTSIAGTSEIWVKLPFLISGIISIWISYLIARLWFDGTTGLFTAAIVASAQFFIMYSQIARPYISGLFLTLLMVYFWSLYFFKNKKTIYLILYVVFSAMSAYNHHFSLLFAAIVGISGLFFVKRKNLTAYAVAGVSIFVLYIPHLNIFFSQLSQGGIGGEGGWLAKPTPSFFFHYISWIFHFSTWVWITVIGVLLFIVLRSGKQIKFENGNKKRVTLFSWFILPLVIGYAYSVLRNPVIQYSMLIFSTPYLLILIFSYHKKVKVWQQCALVSILLLVNVITLVYQRDYYNYFYHQPYEELFKTALLDNRVDDVFILDDCVPYYNEYYFNKYNETANYFTKRNTNISIAGFENVVRNIKENKVVTHALTGEELQIVQSYFPYQTGYSTGFTYEICTFERELQSDSSVFEKTPVAYTDFEDESGNWKDVSDMVVFDTTISSLICQITSDNEWGPSIVIPVKEIPGDGYGILDLEMEVTLPDTIAETLITASIQNEGITVYWKTIDMASYIVNTGAWRKVYMSIDMEDEMRRIEGIDEMELKINIWNISRINLLINNIKISKKPGNPRRYCLYRPCAKP